jgi:hypothetical protein
LSQVPRRNWNLQGEKQLMSGFAAVPSQKSGRTHLTFQINTSNQDRELQTSVEKRVVASCQKVQMTAPTTRDDRLIRLVENWIRAWPRAEISRP